MLSVVRDKIDTSERESARRRSKYLKRHTMQVKRDHATSATDGGADVRGVEGERKDHVNVRATARYQQQLLHLFVCV